MANELFFPPNRLGGSYYHNSLSSGAATTLISVAANTKGAIVRYIAPNYQVAGQVSFYADTAAPTAFSDGSVRLLFAWTNALTLGPYQLLFPLRLPAGVGLFGWSTVAGNAVCVGYDLI